MINNKAVKEMKKLTKILGAYDITMAPNVYDEYLAVMKESKSTENAIKEVHEDLRKWMTMHWPDTKFSYIPEIGRDVRPFKTKMFDFFADMFR